MVPVRRFRFHVSLVTAFLLVLVVMTVVILLVVVGVGNRSVETTTRNLFSSVGQRTVERVASQLATVQEIATLGARIEALAEPVVGTADHPAIPFFRETLNRHDELYSLYVGYPDGTFLQVIPTRGDQRILDAHGAPGDTTFIVRTISLEVGETVERYRFFDRIGSILDTRVNAAPDYDPRTRPWYDRATVDGADRSTILSDIYVFNSLQSPGITAARSLPGGAGVVGVDMTLERLSAFAESLDVSPNGGAGVIAPAGTIIAVNEALSREFAEPNTSPPHASEWLASLPEGVHTTDSGWRVDLRRWTSADGRTWRIFVAAPRDDFAAPFTALRNRIVVVSLLVLLITIPAVVIIARALSRVLSELAAEASRIKELDFEPTERVDSMILEFHQLGEGFRHMKGRLKERTIELNASLDRLAKIIELNIAISAEQDIDRLSELILQGAQELSHADGGSLYIKSADERALDFVIVLNETLGFAQGGTSGSPITLPSVPLFDEAGNPNEHNVVSYTVQNEKTVNIPDAYNASGFDFSGTRRFDESNGYRTQSVLTVPLKPRGSDIIGAIQLLNAKDPDTGETVEFSAEIQRFVEALSAGAATALYNRDLIEEQRRLFDAMIQLIAGAIDAKSPYTGGHCARVPEIAMMLARHAEESGEGPLAAFTFSDDQDWRAFRIGAWLHDAGKVTTPDYVVDKATKLETIYNRIHEIRTRFEVLLRDARIARHEAVLNGADPEEEDAKLATAEAELQEEYAFIAECNLGGEYMAPERIERLKEIAARRWTRYFDDTIGLSWAEQQRRDAAGARSLPAEETLLSDKPEHVIPRTDDFYRQYERFGFTIPVPEHLYNLGEFYNLSIGRGTLSAEERFKINEHVMQTIVMLDRLPFPRTLQNVPEYAGTHHEALNGSGYPRQLTGEDLSVPARIMAIADIFEALTASDRPYKKAKPLSVAVDILYKFKQEGHIDPDLFDLFLTSGVYREYAERYLKPEQLDDVDITKYLG